MLFVRKKSVCLGRIINHEAPTYHQARNWQVHNPPFLGRDDDHEDDDDDTRQYGEV